MKMSNFGRTVLGATAVVSLVLLAVLAVGCEKGTDKPAESATAQKTAEFVNDRCPIIDSPIDFANVPDSLTREYKGKKVAFCCAGCPAAWDKLSDAEKDAALAKVTPAKGD